MSTPGLSWPDLSSPDSTWTLLLWLLLALGAGLLPLLAISVAPLHPWMVALGALAGVVALALLLRNPAWGALALLLIVYWNASEALTKNFQFSWLLKGVMIWTGIAWAVQRLLRARPEPFRWPLWKPVLLYGLVQCASALRAPSPVVAWEAVLEYAKAIVVFYLIVNLLHTPRQWRQGLQTILAAAILLSLPVIYQGVTGSRFAFWGFGIQEYKEIIPGEWGWRPGGSIGDPNFLAMMLVATVPIAAVMLLQRRQQWSRRLLAGGALTASLAATVLTYSRASALAVLFVIALLVAFHPRRKLVLLAVAGGGLLLTSLMPHAFFARLKTLTQASLTRQQEEIADSSFRSRRDEMLTGVLMARTHPLLGVGPGNYNVDFQKYAARMGITPRVIMDPHSLYIQVAAETGLLGLGALFYLLISGWKRIWQARRRLREGGAPQFARLLWGVELGLESYLLTSMFLHGAYFRHFLTLLALAILATSLVEQAFREGAPAAPEAVAPPVPEPVLS